MTWTRAINAIVESGKLEPDWDSYGAEPIKEEVVRHATNTGIVFELCGAKPPTMAYPLVDGNIVLEWQMPDGIIHRIMIGDPNHELSLMTSYPDNRPATFSDINSIPEFLYGD